MVIQKEITLRVWYDLGNQSLEPLAVSAKNYRSAYRSRSLDGLAGAFLLGLGFGSFLSDFSFAFTEGFGGGAAL